MAPLLCKTSCLKPHMIFSVLSSWLFSKYIFIICLLFLSLATLLCGAAFFYRPSKVCFSDALPILSVPLSTKVTLVSLMMWDNTNAIRKFVALLIHNYTHNYVYAKISASIVMHQLFHLIKLSHLDRS